MVSADLTRLRQPSGWWLVLAITAAALAVVAVVIAVMIQSEATKPIGEWEVFVNDARTADPIIREADNSDAGVRVARNHLDIEAVSLVDSSGFVVASTSESLVGNPVENELLRSAATAHRLTALAGSVSQDIWLDGVLAWPAGSILYEVVSPSSRNGYSLLMHYDVSSLLGRRTPPGALQVATVELLAVAVVLILVAITFLFGRGRAARRFRLVALESELLRRHSAELEATNAELEIARASAEEALALAEEKIRIRSEFVLMINHELRTPLTSVVTGADLLRTTEMSNTDREALIGSIFDDGKRLLEIVDQILSVARIENKGLSYELTDVPLSEICETLSGAHTPEPGACDHHDGVAVKTDVKALTTVVASLVDNAKSHGAANVAVVCSAAPRIEPSLEVGERPPNPVFVSVVDDGPGIDPEFLPRAFEKFEKASFSSGTGLGLYMTRMIVESLSGSVAVYSSPDGTTFQIALPASPVRAPAGSAS